jgi:hypothetical protein
MRKKGKKSRMRQTARSPLCSSGDRTAGGPDGGVRPLTLKVYGCWPSWCCKYVLYSTGCACSLVMQQYAGSDQQ